MLTLDTPTAIGLYAWVVLGLGCGLYLSVVAARCFRVSQEQSPQIYRGMIEIIDFWRLVFGIGSAASSVSTSKTFVRSVRILRIGGVLLVAWIVAGAIAFYEVVIR